VSSGASLAAYVWRLSAFAGVLSFAGAMSQQAFAFGGAMLAVAIVFALATRRGRIEPITLLLVGVIVNAVCGSVFLLVNEFFKDPAGSGSAMTFLVGGLQTSLLPVQKYAAAAIIGAGWLILLYLAGRLNVAGLSDDEAASLGVHVHALRWTSLIVASLMTASAVAISGPIGFVGLIGPHVARLVVGVDQRRLLPLATAFGAILLCLADTTGRFLARGTLAGQWLPVGVLTGLLGGPFFLLLLWQTRRRG
jgi:iron complex transport system permease protein